MLLGKLRVLTKAQINDALAEAADSDAVNSVLNAPVGGSAKPSFGSISASIEEVEQGELIVSPLWIMALPGWVNWAGFKVGGNSPTGFEPLTHFFPSRFSADFAEKQGLPSPAPALSQRWQNEQAQARNCDTCLFVYFNGDALVRVKWKHASAPRIEPSAGATNARDVYYVDNGNIVGSAGGDIHLEGNCDYLNQYWQQPWQEAGFYSEADGAVLVDARQTRQDFTLTPDPSSYQVVPRGSVWMRPPTNPAPEANLHEMIQVTQHLFRDEVIPHSLFRFSPVAREACFIGKAEQTVRLPLYYTSIYLKCVATATADSSSVTSGVDFTSILPFNANSTGVSGYFVNPSFGQNNSYLASGFRTSIHQARFQSNASGWVRYLGASYYGEGTTSVMAGLINDIQDEQYRLFHIGVHPHSPLIISVDTSQEPVAQWIMRFAAGELWGGRNRLRFAGSNSWNSAWNTLGADDTLYYLNLSGNAPYFRLDSQGAGGAFAANPQSLVPQFTGVNP